jgi:uncharacterized protein (TIGR02271 family)
MPNEEVDTELKVPLMEEQLSVQKQNVATGRVKLRTVVDERQELVRADLTSESVFIKRVPIDREVESVPEVRRENGTIIFPVVEEVLVVEKRLVLKEEVHIGTRRHTETIEQPVKLRATRAIVERESLQERVDEPRKQDSQENS